MSAVKQSVETPQQSSNTVPTDEVLQALERILVSERFVASPRSCHFLRFVVENALAGRAAELKESVIGLEVFARGSSFDPRNDSVVRVEARRLRAKLADYYRHQGAEDAIVIGLPLGGYVPHFSQVLKPPTTWGIGRKRLLMISAALLLLTIAAGWLFRSSRQEPASNPEALQNYWRGRYMSQQRGEDHLAQSIVLFTQAIQRDPQFAAAHAALAESSATLSFRQGSAASAQSLQESARKEASLALKLNPGQSDAWGTLGALAAFHDWDWKAAEAAFGKGLQLNPRDADVHRWYALALLSQGRFDQALDHIKAAYASNPTSFALEIDLGRVYYAARRFPECVLQATRAVSADPDFGPAHELLGRCYSVQGDYARAIPEFLEALKYWPGRPGPLLGRLGQAYASVGRLPEAQAQQAELLLRLKQGETGWVQLALLQVALKDHEKALDSLENAYAQHQAELSFIAVEPLLDPLRTEPRYQQLIRKLGITGERP